jgi:CMP-N-acetylneuraminic acid synthetase
MMRARGDASTLLAVIPARAGSKRVPGKNVRPLDGRPALAYSIEAAVMSGLFATVVVTTDSEAIATLASREGAEVPFVRDAALSGDDVPVSLATVDALERLDPDGRRYSGVAQLMPNCPLRTAEDVRASYRQFAAGDAPTQLSVTRFAWQNPWWACRQTESLALVPLFPDRITAPSQSLPALFCPTGAVWWARADVLRAARTFHVEGRTGWEIGWDHGVDIDTEEDWRMAEVLLHLRATAGADDGR